MFFLEIVAMTLVFRALIFYLSFLRHNSLTEGSSRANPIVCDLYYNTPINWDCKNMGYEMEEKLWQGESGSRACCQVCQYREQLISCQRFPRLNGSPQVNLIQ